MLDNNMLSPQERQKVSQQYLRDYLVSQGIGPNDWSDLVNPKESLLGDPFDILGMRSFLNRLYELKDTQITVVADYDTDGICAANVMTRGLKLLNIGSQVNTYVPTRMDGYGISVRSVDLLLEEFPDTQTIITVDNGVAALAGIAHAKALGLNVLVTDHHLAQAQLPDADAIIDINRPVDDYAFKGLSGTGMAYKMLVGYAGIVAPNRLSLLKQLEVWVGLSVISDMMPMRGENRYYVKKLVKQLQQFYDGMVLPGSDTNLRILMRELKHAGKIYGDTINEELVGFTISPMFNAASRVTGTPQRAYDFVLTDDVDEMIVASQDLMALNEKRKQLVKDVKTAKMREINQLHHQFAGLATTVDLGPGFVGLIASDLVGAYEVPAVVLGRVDFDGTVLDQGDAVLHGSARSVPGVNIVEVFQLMALIEPDLFLSYGGHGMAAGLSILNQNLAKFQRLFDRILGGQVDVSEIQDLKIRDQVQSLLANIQVKEDVDVQDSKEMSESNGQPIFKLALQDVSMELIQAFEQLRPYGSDFQKPLFEFDNVLTAHRRIMKNVHLKFSTKYKGPMVDFVWWSGLQAFQNMGSPAYLDLVGTLGLNEFRGNLTYQVIVDQIRVSQGPALSEEEQALLDNDEPDEEKAFFNMDLNNNNALNYDFDDEDDDLPSFESDVDVSTSSWF